MLSGNNSILNRAIEAKNLTGEKSTAEAVQLAYIGALTRGNGTIEEGVLREELNKSFSSYTLDYANNKVIIDGKEYGFDGTVVGGSGVTPTPTQVAVLPTGAGTKPYLPEVTGKTFKQLPGTNLSTGSTGGLVITDAEDPTSTTNLGNEYVWVEVPNANLGGSPTYGPNYSAQGLTATEITEELTDDQKGKIEAALWAYTYSSSLITRSTTANTNPSATDYKTTTLGWVDEWYDGCGLGQTEYNTLYKETLKKIYNYGGFWIGRYEAGIEGSNTDKTLARQESNKGTITTNAAIKKDSIPYNWVKCSEAETLAKRLGANLMFGIQWDLTLRYLQATGAVDQTGLTSNSEGWGNYYLEYNLNQGTTVHGYKGTLSTSDNKTIIWDAITSSYTHPNSYDALSAGATERNVKKNIYDLAGNMWEWTLEHATSSASSPCAGRGGGFNNAGSSNPVSGRGSFYTAGSYYLIRFQVCTLINVDLDPDSEELKQFQSLSGIDN